MQSYGVITESDLKILNNGVCTNIHEDGVIVAQHFHFVGACFTGLWKKKTTKTQIERKKAENAKKKAEIAKQKVQRERMRLEGSRKYATKAPSMFARKVDDEWEFALATDNANEADHKFVEEKHGVKPKRRIVRENEIQEAVLRHSNHVLQARQAYVDYRLAQVARVEQNNVANTNDEILHVEANAHNQLQHSTNGNFDSVMMRTAIGMLIFHKDCTDFKEFVSELISTRIDCQDEEIVSQFSHLLFGTHTDCEVFKTLGRIWWDQFVNPTLVLPLRFAHCLDGVDLSSEYYITERFRTLSIPPTLHMEKENTKRNSKRYKPKEENRIARLQNSHPEIARKMIEKQEFNRLQRIHKIQKQQQINNSNKMIEKLELHGFSIPIKITFPQFQNLTEKVLSMVPKQLRDHVHWLDIFASLWTLINNTDYASRWNAIRMLYLNFKVEGMEFAVFAALVFKLYSYLGSNSDVKCPKIQSEMAKLHYVESSPMSIIVTLILTILFKHDPKKNTVEKVISSFKDIPTASTGLEMVIGAASKTFDYVSGACSDEYSLEYRLNKLDKDVKQLLSIEGQKRLKEEKGAFEEVYLMKVESLELAKFVRFNTTQGVLLNKLSYDINTQYMKAQVLGATGHGYRRRPVVLHLNGGAGIGKTRLINYISADTISLILQLENDKYCKAEYKQELMEKVKNYEQFVYFRPVGLKYQQNFKSYSSKIYVCDDANQISPSFQNGEMTYPMELIHLNNSHDHMLNVAEIEKKADALFKSALVIATDNIKRPDLYYLVCEDAYDRRIDFSYTVQIKPEYRTTRISNGAFKHIVNLDKIDPTQSNTHIYEFVDDHNIKYTYEEVIEMLEEKLVEVADSHVKDIKVFGNRALDRLEKRSFNLTTPLANEMAEHFKENIGGASVVKFNKSTETVEIKSEVHGIFKHIKRKTRDVYNKFSDKVEDISTTIEELSPKPTQTLREKYNDFKETMQFAFIAFLLRFMSWRTIDKWEKRFKKTKEFVCENKDVILITTGVLSSVLLAYTYFRSESSSKNKNDPDKRRENKHLQGKYDGGQPTKSAPKGKKPPKTPVKSVPITYTNNAVSKERIDDLAGFLAKPQVDVACQRAYSIAKVLISNSYYIYADYVSNGCKECAGLRGFFIKDRIFVTNRHLIPNNKAEFDTVTFSLYNRFADFENIPIDKVTINTFAHTEDENSMYYDVIWIDFGRVNMKSHCDLTKMSSNGGCDNFVSETEIDSLFGTKIMVCTLSVATEFAAINHKDVFTGKLAWYFEMQHTKITKVNSEAIELIGRDNEDLYTHKTLEYPMQSFPGYCGSVIVGNDGEYPGKIFGIHMAGYNNVDKSYGQIITKEMIESITQLSVHMMRVDGNYNTYIKADEFSFLRTVPHVLRSPSKTKLRKSILYNTVFKSQKEPAHLSFTPDGEHVINKSMRKYLTPHQTISQTNESIFESILKSKLFPERRIRELTREEAIKGIDGNEYICGINRKSSAGYPLNVETKMQGKHEYLGQNDEWILDHPRVQQLIDEFYMSVSKNERPNIAFVATIKDELLKIAKVEAFKSRAFAAAPLPYTIIFREKYLDYFATVMENKVFNFSLVGVNMYSKDVDNIVNMLTEVAPRNSKQFLAGDFTNFDGTLNLNLLWKIYDVIEYFYNRKSEVCGALWNELVDSQQLFGNTIIHVARGQPSGNPATTLINTLYNIGLCYMVLFEVLDEIEDERAEKIQQDLSNYYRGVYYGDDNLHSFHKDFVTIMDPNLITQVMKRHGHVYTTDAKDTTFFEYRFLNEVTILKRHFSYDTYYNRWIAPLELVSIFEPINWDRVKDSQYEMKELQMQVNVRTAIRELSLHAPEVFKEYVPKLLHECRKRNLTLDPECFYNQFTIRKIVRTSDGLLFFSNDYFPQHDPIFDIDEHLELSKWGTTIQLGERPRSSPPKDSQKQTCHQFNPTVNMQKRIAQNNNFSSGFVFNAGAWSPLNFTATSTSSGPQVITITCRNYHLGGNPSNRFTCSGSVSGLIDFSRDTEKYVFNHTLSSIPTVTVTPVPSFGVNNDDIGVTISFTPLQSLTVNEPLWVTQYESPPETFLKPQVHMMRHTDTQAKNPDQRQITLLDTVMNLKQETVPKDIVLDMAKLAVMKEKREHTIKNVLSRMYTILDIELPPGGTTNDTIQNIDILSEFLTQNNVSAKLDGFTFLRSNFIITILTRTLTTTSGGIIASFYPQLPNINTRSQNIMQASQTPEERISVSGSQGIELKVPFISAFYGKNLITGSGDIGHVVIKLLTSLNINPTSLKVYIQADEDEIEVTYPTFANGPNAREKIERQIEALREKQQYLINNVRDEMVRVEDAHVLAQNVARRLNLPDVVARPRVHMEKSSTKSNTISVKWQPASNHINKDGEDIAHHISLSRDNKIKISNEFGSSLNEMTVSHIGKSKNIIAVRRISTSMTPGHIVYARPCSIVDFMSQDGEVSMTHQTWLAMMAQKWKATLDFKATLYLNQFHAVTLTFIFNPSDQGEFQEGQTLNHDMLNLADRMVVELDGERSVANFEIKPAMNTAMKSVPTSRLGNVTANALTWTNDCYSEECSYGMFYIAAELKLKTAQTVAPFVDMVIDFSARDLCLGDPIEYVPLVPSVHCEKARVHMDAHGLTTATAEVAENETRSEHFDHGPQASDNVKDSTHQGTIENVLGDNIENIKDMLDAYTPFAPIQTIQNGEALAIETYSFRTLSDLAVDDKFHYHDWIDYFAAGFAYYKGKINLRLGKITEQQAPFGEVNSTTRRNPVAIFGSSSGKGVVSFSAPHPAKCGSRVIPLFKEECVPQINNPYYQPFHMSRITNSNTFNSANQPKIVIFRPYNTELIRVSRATDKDFRFGFLTALPTFQLVSGSIYE